MIIYMYKTIDHKWYHYYFLSRWICPIQISKPRITFLRNKDLLTLSVLYPESSVHTIRSRGGSRNFIGGRGGGGGSAKDYDCACTHITSAKPEDPLYGRGPGTRSRALEALVFFFNALSWYLSFVFKKSILIQNGIKKQSIKISGGGGVGRLLRPLDPPLRSKSSCSDIRGQSYKPIVISPWVW